VDYTKAANRRQFFVDYATEKKFNPSVPESWYSVYEDLLSMKGLKPLLQYYKGSVVTALLQLFPDIGLKRSKFRRSDDSKRKRFFTKYAHDKLADPLVPETWYSIVKVDFLRKKGAKTALQWHRGSFENALANSLVQLFPNIGLDKRRMMKKRQLK